MNGIDQLPNESDQLLSDRYILQKEIKALSKTLQDSTDILNALECDLKNKLILKAQLDTIIDSFEEIQKLPGLVATTNNLLTVWVDNLKANSDLQELTKTLKIEINDFSTIKQLLMDNDQLLVNEIKRLMEKIENRNMANSEVSVEADHLKVQLEGIIASIPPAKAGGN